MSSAHEQHDPLRPAAATEPGRRLGTEMVTGERQRLHWLDFLRGRGGDEEPRVAEGEQQRLRSHVTSASSILPPKGPIDAFVAQNPLQGLEHLPFDRAVREARHLLGGRGYLSNAAFRRIAASGRIGTPDLLRALAAQVPDLLSRPPLEVRGRRVEAQEVLLAHLRHDIAPLPHGTLRWQLTQAKATRRLRPDVPPETRSAQLERAQQELHRGLAMIGDPWTLCEWLEAQMGLDLIRIIHARIGEALRAHAGEVLRARGGERRVPLQFWVRWRAACSKLTCRIARTPEDHVNRCLEWLGIPRSRRHGYLEHVERHRAAWSGLEHHGARTATEFAALWLHYEVELLRELAPRHLGMPGTLPAIQRQCQRDLEAYAVFTLWAAVLGKLGLGDPVSVEEQEAHATEALLHRVLGVARDGGMAIPHTTAEESLSQRVQAALRPDELSRDGVEALERLLEMREAEARGREESATLRRRDPRADLVRSAQEALERDLGRIGPAETLGELCERLTGARLRGAINDQLIRWCAAFLDEGLAAWPMPGRERGFYTAWRTLAERDPALRWLGVKGAGPRIRQLPPEPEDALIALLRALGIPEARWTEYLTRHLAALPGWASMVKWRATHPRYEMQERYPIDLAQYLAVRLVYEAELVATLCRREWGIAGTLPALHAYFWAHPGEYYARTEIARGELPDVLGSGIGRTSQGTLTLRWDALTHPAHGEMRKAKGLSRHDQWFRFAEMLYVYRQGGGEDHDRLQAVTQEAWRLFQLAQLLGLSAEDIRALPATAPAALLGLLEALPPTAHGPLWLQAYETHYRDQVLTSLHGDRKPMAENTRPQAQIIFCLDMREEGIRRHLEAQSEAYETFGTAGFFTMPMIFRPLASGVEKPSCPIPIDPRHTVVEAIRPGQSPQEDHYRYRARWKEVLHGLYHRLETNFATAYSLIDLLGVPFGISVMGRTLLPRRWRALTGALRDRLLPPVRTSLQVERPTEEAAEALLVAQEREQILEAVRRRDRGGHTSHRLSVEAIEEFRRAALAGGWLNGQTQVARLLGLSRAEEFALMGDLRRGGLDPRHRVAELAKFRALGFSQAEQADLVEAQLRMIGLTHNFSRLILFCGHGSTTENNPYAAAYHCGACGGNRGGPNARAIATMLNAPAVRSQLRQRGLPIPDDTYFLGAEHDTAADRVTFFDTEDLPSTHREEFQQLVRGCHQAAALHAQERCRRLPLAPKNPTPERALRHVQTRALDWTQVYPEWGHATCAVLLIGRRELTRGLFLDRRAYLQSYDPNQDADGAILEEIMSAFIPVVRGITLDYYFSSIDSGITGVFGAGTKALHNVVGLVGVMQGAGGDLKPGLPAQGVAPLHEAMRAHIIVESQAAKVASIVGRHKVLENLFKNQWAHLIAWDPMSRKFLGYQPDGSWETLSLGSRSPEQSALGTSHHDR